MPALMEAPKMARVKRNDTSVKVDAEVIRQAKITAAIRNITLAEYLSAILKPIVEKDYREAVSREAQQPKPSKR